jgi:hypothetical protein
MAEAFRLLVALPFVAVVIARAAVFLLLEVFLSYERYSAILQSLALSSPTSSSSFVVEVDWSRCRYRA